MTTMFVITVFVGLIVLLVLYHLLKPEPEVKAGVYRQPGRWHWLKRFIFFLMFHLRSSKREQSRKGSKKNLSRYQDDLHGYGKGIEYDAMEKPQPLINHFQAIDCAYFGGTNKDGCNFACRIARRKNHCSEVWLFLEVPGIGCLQFPHHPDTDVYYTDGSSYKAGGLSFEILEPMRRWRVSYSGKLRKGLCNDVQNKPKEYVETSFNFIWSAFSQPFNNDTDMATSLLGDSIAREVWDKDFFERLKGNHQTHYEQWGELRGRLSVEGHEERQLYLQTVRDHSFGKRDWRSFHRYIIHFIYLESGMTIQVGVVSQPDLMSHVKVGYLSYANGDIVSLTDVDLKLWEVAEDTRDPPSSWTFSFVADGLKYDVKARRGTTPVWYHHGDRGGQVMEVFTDFVINSLKGRGIAEFFYINPDGPTRTSPPLCPQVSEPSEADVKNNKGDITLPFTNLACSSSTLVGGKGAQLAQLTSIQTEVNAKVPPGFCLTLRSFELQLQENEKIADAIKSVADLAVSDLTNLPSACNKAGDLLSSTDICTEVKSAIHRAMKDCFDADMETVHCAVRSSAAGEDGTEASSAGQMETILGVVGLSQICKAVQTCWASVYTVQAVEYRRQHGQPISVSVGVVIQKMVPAQAAGVMFTANPITGSNSSIVINANYGLGESVVSGKSDPDTITVDRDPEFVYDASALKIGSVRAGEKKMKIVETEQGGIIEEAVAGDTTHICLADNMILKLSALGLELEKRFGSARDIEWAVVGEDIFMLQCRPITVTENETEEELVHEFDSPMTCDNQWLTTANISEMMPGAVTPLTLSTFRIAIEYALQKLNTYTGARRRATSLPKCLPANCNHLFICLIDVGTILIGAMMTDKKMMEISLLGNLLPELKMEDIQKYFGRPPLGIWRRFINFLSMVRMSMTAGKQTSKWEKQIPRYQVGREAATAEQLYQCIDDQLEDFHSVWMWTLINSSKSGNMANAILPLIGGDATTWTMDHFSDIAMLFSKCEGVYSAEVPYAMEDIAREIAKSGSETVESFIATPDKECMTWLKSYPNVEKKVETFLQRHGHRCLRESELREKSWRSSPDKFMTVIKMMLKTKAYERSPRPNLSASDMISKMKIQIPYYKKLILKFWLPKAWKAVGEREWGKSVSIEMNEIFKLAYTKLGNLLHKEGRLPDPDLIFFLTHQEIGTLLSTHSAKLIMKAQKRRKVLPKQAEKKFDKIHESRPVPINRDNKKSESSSVECLRGMPVSQGQVTGPAQVVHSLEEASVIKAGDILVVNSTDVGWSPYFPLIGGLITELGGLISHGAVVAREYGIPCVVNVANATAIIRTGETIELDGRMGTVKRLTNKEMS